MASIITNTSAMTALKVLRQTETALGTTQERISTGLKVNSAKDDASTWAIAQGIKSDVATFKTIGEGLTMASGALGAASKAATSIKDQITSIQQNIAKAQQPGADKAAIQQAIDASLSSIAGATGDASFNGTNLVKGTDQLKVLSSISRDASGTATANFIDVNRQDLTMDANGGLSMLKGLNVSDDALAVNANAGKAQLAVDLSAAAIDDGQLSFSYTSSSGQAKTVSLNYASGATHQSIAASFVKTFGDQLKADGINVEQGATAAGVQTGELTFTAAGTGSKVGQITAGAGLDAAATQASQAVIDFAADAAPEVGKEFTLNVSVGGKDYGIKLRVVETGIGGATGDKLGVDGQGNQIIALDQADVGNGDDLATNIAAALIAGATAADGTTPLFAATATTGTALGVAVDGTDTTKLVIESATTLDGTVPDSIKGFQQPTANFADLQATIDAAAKIATSAAQTFGTAQSQAASQKEFLSAMIDSLETGVGALIDADITAESARLSALQTQQQLATQSLSIANQSNQLVMSLFR